MITRESLVSYLQSELALDVNAVDDDTALFSDGHLDSFSVGDLLLFLETSGGFTVEPDEVVVENIDTINNILGFAQRKCGVPVGQ